VPELVDQYAKAFEKVWAHRQELGKGWKREARSMFRRKSQIHLFKIDVWNSREKFPPAGWRGLRNRSVKEKTGGCS
jgi:hypothetical protein